MNVIPIILAGIGFGVTFFITSNEIWAFGIGILVYGLSTVIVPIIQGTLEFHKKDKNDQN